MNRSTRWNAMVVAVAIVGVASFMGATPTAARGTGGASGGRSNAGGAVRGVERADDVAPPQGVQHGIDNAETRIDKKDNARNPNTQDTNKTKTKRQKPAVKK